MIWFACLNNVPKQCELNLAILFFIIIYVILH
jgi:hypothetical protein